MCKILLRSALACWERWDRPVLCGAGGVELALRPHKQHPVPLQHPVRRRCSQGRDGGAGRAAWGHGSGAARLTPSPGQIPMVRATLQEASNGPSLGNILSHHFCKTRLQTASFSATAPGPRASSSRTRRSLLGESSRASLRPVKLEGFLFVSNCLVPPQRLHQQKRPSATSQVKTQRWAGERGRNTCACSGHPGQNPRP